MHDHPSPGLPATDRPIDDGPITDRSIRDRTKRTIDDRAALERLLAGIVRRLRLRGALGALALGACWLFGALVVYQLALAVTAPASLLEPIRWMLVIAVVLALAFIAHRSSRPVTIRDAASLADREADLSDELKSAYYFSRIEVGSREFRGREDRGREDKGREVKCGGNDGLHGSLVALLLERAAISAGRFDPRCIVPLILPRSATPALALAIAAAGLAWWSPRWTSAIPDAGGAESRAAARPFDQGDRATHNPLAPAAQPSAAGEDLAATTDAKARGRAAIDEPGAEDIGRSAGQSERSRGQPGAAPARDTRRLAQPTDSIDPPEHDLAVKPSEDRSFAQVARPTRHRSGSADDSASDPAPTANDLFRAQIDRQGLDGDKSAENDLQRAMKAAEQRAAEQGSKPPPQTRAGNPDNANSNGPRPDGPENDETQFGGQMEGNNPGGNSEVADGSGQNVSLAAGADSRNPADAEHSKSLSDIAAAPVEGPKTMRLQAQLQRVRIDGRPADDSATEGAEEQLYAATRAQRSRIDYQAAASQPRQTGEAAITGERVPLAHRAVVKDYFLNLRDANNSNNE